MYFLLIIAHKNRLYSKLEEDKLSLSLLEGRVKFPFDGPTYPNLRYRINDVVHPPAADLAAMEIVNAYDVDVMVNVPFAIPVIAHGDGTAPETVMDINVFHCLYGHSNEFYLRETTTKKIEALYRVFRAERLSEADYKQDECEGG